MNMDSMHLHIYIYIYIWIKDSMVIWCDNIDTKEDFLEEFWWSNFFMYLELWFFLLSYLFNKKNILEAHLSNFSSP
jgi:hypothetical protein